MHALKKRAQKQTPTHVDGLGTQQEPASTNSERCMSCHKVIEGDAVKVACERCEGYPLYTAEEKRPIYCGSDCKSENEELHGKDCQKLQRRRLLHRVGCMMQMAWNTYRLEASENWIKAVEVVAGTDPLQIDVSWDFEWQEVVVEREKSWLHKQYPLEGVEDEILHMIVAHDTCKRASFRCVPTIAAILEGETRLCAQVCAKTDINRVSSKIASTKRKYVLKDDINDSWHPDHEFLRLRTKDDEVWVMDLSGAQYGFNEGLYTWPEYEELTEDYKSNDTVDQQVRTQATTQENDGEPIGKDTSESDPVAEQQPVDKTSTFNANTTETTHCDAIFRPKYFDQFYYSDENPWKSERLRALKRRDNERWSADLEFRDAMQEWLKLTTIEVLVGYEHGLMRSSEEKYQAIVQGLKAYIIQRIGKYVKYESAVRDISRLARDVDVLAESWRTTECNL